MKLAIVIGSYRMPAFVNLNIRSCRDLLGDVDILVSDDYSGVSDVVQDAAFLHNASYIVSSRRMSHFSGDVQAFINGLVFGAEAGADVVLKLSQRMVPIDRKFFDPIFAMTDDQWVATPGRLPMKQIARPNARFYTKFGLLTDAVAMRVGRIKPERIADLYRNRFENGKDHMASMVELTWGALLAEPDIKDHHIEVKQWTEHEPMEPKLYLRKSQSTQHDYLVRAGQVGMSIQARDLDVREWIAIEGREEYRMRPTIV